MITVYIADDEIWITIGLKKLIQKSELPFRVVGESGNGVTALEDIRRLCPDVFLADIRMPGLTGLELLTQIAEEQLTTKVVLISGYADFEYARTAMRCHAFDYLLKPVHPQELYRVLQRLAAELSPDPQGDSLELSGSEPPACGFLGEILEKLQREYTEDISLAGLSEAYGISAGYLSSLIKKELGISFSEYITSKRIQLARELLRNEALSIESVANAVGYHDYFYFTKVFKKTTGISPSKYRKEL